MSDIYRPIIGNIDGFSAIQKSIRVLNTDPSISEMITDQNIFKSIFLPKTE